VPTTILSGNLKSLIASPSLKNSGFDITANLLFLFLIEIIFSTLSPVETGTVDLLIIILNLFIYLDISFAALNTYFKSAEPFLEVGVPTQIKLILLILVHKLEFFYYLTYQFFP